ncbi:MAG: RNA-binding domain-containing protein [Conexivisphaerales archaeon]
MEVIFDSAEVTFHIHATEDKDKIYRSIQSVLGFDTKFIQESKAYGHFGNTILVCRAILDKELSSSLFNRIITSATSEDLNNLREEIRDRVEDNKFLHVRLDKQMLVSGFVKLGDEDSLKVRFRLTKYGVQNIQNIVIRN